MPPEPRTRVSFEEVEEGIARIRVDDGKVNALSAGLLGEIAEALDAAETVQAVVELRGRPGIFSAGFDLATFQRGPVATLEMLLAEVRVLERLLAYPFPILAVCTGHAYPAGAFLLLASDVRLGVDGPYRIGLNETAIGLTLPRFAVELVRHRLAPHALPGIATAVLHEPHDARDLGYLDRVLDPEALDAAVAREATRLRALEMEHFAATKARINGPVAAAVRVAAQEELRRP